MTRNPASRSVADLALRHGVSPREALRAVIDAKHSARVDDTAPLHLPAGVLPRAETRPR